MLYSFKKLWWWYCWARCWYIRLCPFVGIHKSVSTPKNDKIIIIPITGPHHDAQYDHHPKIMSHLEYTIMREHPMSLWIKKVSSTSKKKIIHLILSSQVITWLTKLSSLSEKVYEKRAIFSGFILFSNIHLSSPFIITQKSASNVQGHTWGFFLHLFLQIVFD